MNNAMIGDNVGAPYAEGVAERLALDYSELIDNADSALGAAKTLPEIVNGSDDVAPIGDMVKKLRDIAARAESHRKAEKEPYLRAGDAVFAFFTKRVIDPLDAERKRQMAKLDAFKQRQLAEERVRREAEAAAARKAEQERQRLLAEAEAAARRARSEQTRMQAEAEARQARIEADMAAAKAEETELATLASSTAIVRERFEGNERSGLVGMRKKKIAVVTDVAQLDMEKLRFYFKPEHLEQALRAWAAATGFKESMPGALITTAETTVVR